MRRNDERSDEARKDDLKCEVARRGRSLSRYFVLVMILVL